jgi:hypothetical protein
MKLIELVKSEFEYLINNFRDDSILNSKESRKVENFNNFLLDTDIEASSNSEFCDLCKNELNYKFFHNGNYQRIGNAKDCSIVNHMVGHLVSKTQLINELNSISKEDPSEPEFNINPKVTIDELFEDALLIIPDELINLRIRKFQTWCFINRKMKKSLIDGINPDNLSELLALDDTTTEKIFFELRKPSKTIAFQPTAFDAGFSLYWKPGGYTIPQGKSHKEEGLEEVILDKVYFKDVASKLITQN